MNLNLTNSKIVLVTVSANMEAATKHMSQVF